MKYKKQERKKRDVTHSRAPQGFPLPSLLIGGPLSASYVVLFPLYLLHPSIQKPLLYSEYFIFFLPSIFSFFQLASFSFTFTRKLFL